MLVREIVFNKILTTLSNHKYCILRNYEQLPESDNDIDILIEKNRIIGVMNKLKIELEKVGVILIRVSRFNCYSLFFLILKLKIIFI